MTEIVVTLKAGPAFSDPWVVLHTDTVEDMQHQLQLAREALIENVAYVAKIFANTYTGTPNNYIELLKKELGAEVVSMEPAPIFVPNPQFSPPRMVDTPDVTAEKPPWERTQSAGAWAPPAPAESNVYLIEVPRDKMDAWSGPKGPDGKAVQGGGIRGAVQAELAKRGFDRKTMDWDAVAKRNTIKRDAPADMLDYIRSQGIELK